MCIVLQLIEIGKTGRNWFEGKIRSSILNILCLRCLLDIQVKMYLLDMRGEVRQDKFGSYQNIEMGIYLPFLATLYMKYTDNSFLLCIKHLEILDKR